MDTGFPPRSLHEEGDESPRDGGRFEQVYRFVSGQLTLDSWPENGLSERPTSLPDG